MVRAGLYNNPQDLNNVDLRILWHNNRELSACVFSSSFQLFIQELELNHELLLQQFRPRAGFEHATCVEQHYIAKQSE